jgi:hypothetical protein
MPRDVARACVKPRTRITQLQRGELGAAIVGSAAPPRLSAATRYAPRRLPSLGELGKGAGRSLEAVLE